MPLKDDFRSRSLSSAVALCLLFSATAPAQPPPRAAVPGPEEEFEMTERKERVLEMLRHLPEHQRSALLLREQEEMSYREIAEVLGVSEAKVKVDVFRARTSLRERWGRKQSALAARGQAG